MKKKKIELGKKLFLAKEIISMLNTDQQNSIQGGATIEQTACSPCFTQEPVTVCGGPCPSVVCPTQPRLSCLQACFSLEGTPSVCQFC